MAAQPIYIETEEEIPEVIERVRSTPSEDIPLVLPTRSRFGQSRFNFQLLRQYASGLGKRISIVSPDPAVQQMAEENGFRAFRAVEQMGGEPETAARPAAAAGFPSLADLPARPAPAPAAAAPRMVVQPPARVPSRLATEGRPGRLLLYAGAGLMLMAGLVAGALYVPAATVTVRADATAYSADVQVDAAQGQPPVRVRTVSETKQASGSFPATGVKTTPGTVANGTVTYNNQCPTGFIIKDGQRLSGGGQTFAQKGDLTIDPGKSGSVSIVATAPGAAGNVGAGVITTINNAPFGCLTVTNPSATSGGADEKKETQIQASDLENARSALESQVRKEIGDDLAKQAQPGEKLADSRIQFAPPDFGSDQPVGTVAQKFNATIKIGAEGAFYSPDDVQKAFSDLLKKRVPAGKELTDNKVKTSYDIINASSGGHLSFRGTASSYIAPSVDRDRLKGQLAAKSVGAARSQLARLPIRAATIKQSPFALPLMPLTASRISIVYEIDQVATTTPSPPAHS